MNVATSRALERLTGDRRHTGVLSESLRDDIQMIAEAAVAPDATLERRLQP